MKKLKKLFRKHKTKRRKGPQAEGSFNREIRAVHAGIRAHKEEEGSFDGQVFQLRRNIHRLEKGLIMVPRRDVFALNYIEETMGIYERLYAAPTEYPSEMKWFHDVLQAYFSATGSHETINACRARFEALDANKTAEEFSVPATRATYPESKIDYIDFLTLCQRRRSVRWYSEKPVPRELVDQAITAAALSPSACNRQPFEFRIFDDPGMVKKVAEIPMGTRGFTHQFPMIIVLVGKLNAYEFERDRHVIYIDGALAAMSFMLALETLGLSSCPINWPDIEENEVEMDETLGLNAYERPVMLISVGYAKDEGLIPFSHKREIDRIRRYN